MLEFFRGLFGTDFMPHLYCLRSDPGTLWLHVFSDLAIAAAYFAIPLVLFDVVRKRTDLLFRKVALLFVLFIAACGSTHVLAVWTIWIPVYRFEGVAKAATALFSVVTAVVLLRLRPTLLKLPSVAELESEVEERIRIERAAHEKEERLRNFVESVQDYALYWVDIDGVIRSWNAGAERMTGYSAEEMIGQSCPHIFVSSAIGDRNWGSPGEILRTVQETGRFEGEGRMLRKDGTVFLAHVMMRPLLDPKGNLQGFSKVTRDVTETRALEAKYQILMDATPDGILMIDAEERILFANKRMATLFGYSPEELLGMNCLALAPEGLRARQARRHQEFFRDPGSFELDHDTEPSGLRKDGSQFHVEASFRPLQTPSGLVAVISVRDVGERIKTEARFRAMLEAAPDAVVIYAKPDRIAYVNRRAEELFGRERTELLGQPADILVPERLREERRAIRQELFRTATLLGRASGAERLCLRKDGSEFQAEISVSPIETPEGEVLLAFLRDTTQRKTTEARFSALLESAPDAMVIVDKNGVIELANLQTEKIFGYLREELIGQSVEILVPENVRASHGEHLKGYFRTPNVRAMGAGLNLMALRKDGSQFPVEISLSPLEGPSGTSVTAAIRDITARRLAEEAAREREERFRSFVDSVEDYAIYMIDPQGLIQTWNHGAQRMKGYSAEEIVGRSFSIFYTAEDRTLGKPQEALRIALETGMFRGEGRRVRKDGSQFLVNVIMRPLRDSHGVLTGFSKVTRDITESRELETRFQVLLEAAPDAFLIVNRAGEIEFINAQGEKIFGYAREEVLGKSVDMFNPERVREMQAVYRDQLFNGSGRAEGGSETDLWGLRKDGSEFPLEFTLSPLDTKDGRVFLFALRDITERKKTEARFQALLESAPDAMVIVNSDGCIELANRQTEKLFGYSRMELVGQSVDILVPLDLRGGHSAHRGRFFASPKPRQMGAGLDLEARRKDGTLFPVEISLSPLEGPDGVSVTAAIRDVTERKKAETRFRALLESAPDAMVIVNSDGMIELINAQAERLFGYHRAELIGKILATLLPEHLREKHKEHRKGFFLNPRQREMGAGLDLRARRKDGTEFPVEISLSPLEGPDGISVTAAIRDITERKTAARHLAEKMAELHQSNEALEQFAHIASHDLQEPLRMVASYTQLLSRRYKGRLDADADEFIDFAVDGTQRMKRLIEDLLLYSRAGKGAPPMGKFDAERPLHEAIRNLRAAIEESGAEVTSGPLPALTAVESQLVQIFQNLIGNAIKYRGDRVPHIHVTATEGSEEWVFSVADNGIGIDPRYYDRIFQIFQRLHGRGEYEGTGIGLAICKRILQQQGGRIWVESEPGQGSTFHFSLPMR